LAMLESIVTNCKYKSYILMATIAPARSSWLFSRRDSFNPHIRAKHFRDHDRAVCLLVVLHYGNPSSPHRKS